MELANVTLALGGDTGNTVQKYNVTPSEVAVLRFIHGDDAVTDIDITGSEARNQRGERGRLIDEYGRNESDGRRVAPAVEALFPGVAARVYESFDELELPDDLFKAERRPRSAPVAEAVPKKGKGKGKGKKAADPVETAQDEVGEDPDDTAQDMPDSGIFSEK